MDPRVAPEIELAHVEPALRQQIVERQRMPGDQPRRDVRPAQQDRRLAAEADVRDGGEVPVQARGHRREQQRHAIDEQRLHDPVHQPLAQAEEIEIAVQVAGESDEGAAVVVAIAVIDAIEPCLNGVLQRPAEQHDHERREQRDDGVADRIARRRRPR